MSTNEKKGITTKVNLGLHAKAKEFMASHDDMKMESFISNAIESYLASEQQKGRLHKMRTLAFQVPEDFFQEVKDYLDRHGNMKQNKFVLGLIRQELDRDLAEREELDEEQDESAYNDEIVEDEDEELTEDEPTEDELTEDDEQIDEELTEDELDEDTDIEQTDGELDEADEYEDIDQGDEQDEDEEESEGEEFSEDEEETASLTMCGM